MLKDAPRTELALRSLATGPFIWTKRRPFAKAAIDFMVNKGYATLTQRGFHFKLSITAKGREVIK